MSDPFAPEPSGNDESFAPPVVAHETSPPLGIGHLLLWTACSAVLLTARKLLYEAVNTRPNVFLNIGPYEGFWAINYGLAIAGVIVCLVRWWRGTWLNLPPGGRLLLIMAVIQLSSLLGSVGITFFWPWLNGHAGLYFSLLSLWITVYGVAGLLKPIDPWWRFFFLIMAIAYVCQLAVSISLAAGLIDPFDYFDSNFEWFVIRISPFCELALVAFPIGMDYARSIRWNWFHWTGIFVFAAQACFDCITSIVRWF